MTRNEKIIRHIKEFTDDLISKGPKACRDYLISIGIYDKHGNLTPQYGGGKNNGLVCRNGYGSVCKT